MNDSGRAVQEAANFFKLAAGEITVFQDELELPPAKVRVKVGGGIAGHNGLRSISSHIGNDYRRVRLGIGPEGAAHADGAGAFLQVEDVAAVEQGETPVVAGQAAAGEVLFALVFVGDGAVDQDFAEEEAEEAVADDAAADVLDGVVPGEFTLAGGGVELGLTVGKDFEADGVEGADLAIGGLVLALDGFETTDVGEAGELVGDVAFDAGEEEDAGGQKVLGCGGGGEEEGGGQRE
jgi:hypothetical protein